MTAKEHIGKMQLASPPGVGIGLKRGAYQKHIFIHPMSHIWQYNVAGSSAIVNYYFETGWGGGGHLYMPAGGQVSYNLPPLAGGLYRVRVGYYQYNGGGTLGIGLILADGSSVTRANLSTHNATTTGYAGSDANLARSITDEEGLSTYIYVTNATAVSYWSLISLDRISA